MLQSVDEYWDIVRNDIYPQGKSVSTVSLYCINIEHTGKYVYISPATSFLKGRVKGHWYRGKEVTESQLHITISRCIPGDLRKVPVCGPCHQQEVAPQ